MRIIIQTRANIKEYSGGDKIFIEELKKRLETLGHQVEISGLLHPNLKPFDIVHCFGLTRVHEAYIQVMHAKNLRKPVVLSPLYEDLTEWNKKGRYGLLSILYKIFKDINTRELIKTYARALKEPRQRETAHIQRKIGYKRQQHLILQKVDYIIPSSRMEKEAVERDIGPVKQFKIIPYVIDEKYKDAKPDLFLKNYNKKDFVLSVGRIESKKNQLALIKALRNESPEIVFIGKINPWNKRYVSLFKQAIKKNHILHLDYVSEKMLMSAYAAAKVHVLPSWFEVAGMASLEAGLAGANVVTTDRGYAKEYFKDYAWYCDPSDIQSIRKATLAAFSSPRRLLLKDRILAKYTWKNVIQSFLRVYKKALMKK